MSKTFPTPDSIVAQHNEGSKKFRKKVRRMNKVISFLYRIYLLPLFGAGKKFMIIETIGRKTGKRRLNPVIYDIFYTGKITIVLARGRNTDWMKNIDATNDGVFKIHRGFKKFKVKKVLIENDIESYEHLEHFCLNYKGAKGFLGFDKETDMDLLNTEEFRNILNIIQFIQLEIVE